MFSQVRTKRAAIEVRKWLYDHSNKTIQDIPDEFWWNKCFNGSSYRKR
jgi:hypothetical protein